MAKTTRTLKAVGTAGRSAGASISPDQRQKMIEEAAYFIAEHRGFQGGDPIADWLQAESYIDQQISGAA